MEVPNDLVRVSAAEKAAGLGGGSVKYWVQSKRLRAYGEKPVLVSLAEVQRVAAERSGYPISQAIRVLGMEYPRVVALCKSGVIPFTRRAKIWSLDRATVDRLAAEREEDREAWLSIEQAAEATGWSRRVLLHLEREELLETRPGDGRQGLARVMRRDQLLELKASYDADPDRCEICGDPVPPARRVHKACAVKLAGGKTGDPTPGGQTRAMREAELDAFRRANDLRTLAEVAALVKRSRRVTWIHAAPNNIGTVYKLGASHKVRLFTSEDVGRLQVELERALDVALQPGWKRTNKSGGTRISAFVEQWADGPVRKAWQGRLAADIATAKGKKVGNPGRLTDEQIARIHNLRAKGKSLRTIAILVGVSRGSVENELRKQPDNESVLKP
jgi:hypothetical protein